MIQLDGAQALGLLAVFALSWLILRLRRRWAREDFVARETCGICGARWSVRHHAHGRVCSVCDRALRPKRSWRLDDAAAERLLRAIFEDEGEDWQRGTP